MRKVIKAFVLEDESNIYKTFSNGSQIVKQSSGSYVLFSKNGNVIKTYQNKDEVSNDEKSVVTHKTKLTSAMIAKAKRLHVWKTNPFDTEYGGNITDWGKFHNSK